MDQDSDACPAVDRVQLEKVERPDGDAAEGFDDEPLLAGLKDVELLLDRKSTRLNSSHSV